MTALAALIEGGLGSSEATARIAELEAELKKSQEALAVASANARKWKAALKQALDKDDDELSSSSSTSSSSQAAGAAAAAGALSGSKRQRDGERGEGGAAAAPSTSTSGSAFSSVKKAHTAGGAGAATSPMHQSQAAHNLSLNSTAHSVAGSSSAGGAAGGSAGTPAKHDEDRSHSPAGVPRSESKQVSVPRSASAATGAAGAGGAAALTSPAQAALPAGHMRDRDILQRILSRMEPAPAAESLTLGFLATWKEPMSLGVAKRTLHHMKVGAAELEGTEGEVFLPLCFNKGDRPGVYEEMTVGRSVLCIADQRVSRKQIQLFVGSRADGSPCAMVRNTGVNTIYLVPAADMEEGVEEPSTALKVGSSLREPITQYSVAKNAEAELHHGDTLVLVVAQADGRRAAYNHELVFRAV